MTLRDIRIEGLRGFGDEQGVATNQKRRLARPDWFRRGESSRS